MPSYLDTFNQFVSVGVILLQVTCGVLILTMLFVQSHRNPVRMFFKQYTFVIGFIVSLGSVALSLFYSNVIGFPPCELCWINRIFIYPQLILFAMELYKRDRTIVDFSIAFSLLSVVTSLYHVYIERGGASSLSCATQNVANQVSCATRYVFEFSYITIPIMALSASLLLLLVMVNYKYMSRK